VSVASAQARTQRYVGRSTDAVSPSMSAAAASMQAASGFATVGVAVRKAATIHPTRAAVSPKQTAQLAPNRSPLRQAGSKCRA
jgi:hypothetical protein